MSSKTRAMAFTWRSLHVTVTYWDKIDPFKMFSHNRFSMKLTDHPLSSATFRLCSPEKKNPLVSVRKQENAFSNISLPFHSLPSNQPYQQLTLKI